MMAKKTIKEEEVNLYLNKYKEIKNNKKEVDKLFDTIEKNVKFCGTSAIEDKLQDGVPETINTLIACNIHIWLLTGDKVDTSLEIAKSSNLINDNMFLIFLTFDGGNIENKLRKKRI